MSDQHSVTDKQPEIRVRIAHAFTAKDGWRLDATTIEWTGSGEPDWVLIGQTMDHAYTDGSSEAAHRNHMATAEVGS